MSAPKQNWFLLRGLVRETADWGDFPAQLQQALPEGRIRCLDLPGNGRHFQVKAPLTLKEIVDFTRQEFLAKQIPGVPNYLLAISLGAMVAIDWLQRFPNEIAGAVLINTSVRELSPFFRRLSPGAYPTILKLFLTTSVRKREAEILRLTSSRDPLPPGVLEKRTAAREERPVSRVNALRQILAATRSEFRKEKPSTPVLLLNSLGDKLVHPDCSERLREVWDVPLRRHPSANHDLPLDDPQWTITAIADWLASR